MNTSTTIAKNTSWFTVALVIQKVIAFIYFTYLARILGAESLGMYTFALSYISIFSIIIDFGTNHYITREIAKDNRAAKKITANVFGFKIFSSVVAVGVALSVAQLLGYDPVTQQLLLAAVIAMVFESFVLSVYAIIRGFHTLRYESQATVAIHIIIALVGFVVAATTQNILLLVGVLILAHCINLAYGLWLLTRRFSLPLRLRFDYQYWKKIGLAILPFALAAGFSKVYGAFDQIVLSKLATPDQLGFYAVAYKLTFALQFVPMALMASLYPAMSTFFATNKQELSRVVMRALYYLLIITLPLAGGIVVFAQPVIVSLYTEEYAASVIPLQILVLSLPFLFINFPIGSLLNASDNQKKQTRNIGIALGLNIILNLVLIPVYQAAGAALASTISTILFFVLGWSVVRTVVVIDSKAVLQVISKTLIATVGMVVIGLWVLAHTPSWLIAVLIASVVYVVIQLLLQTISKRELRVLLDSFRR